MIKSLRGLTLLELFIAISLLALIVVGFSGIELFSHRQMVSAERRVKLQTELVLVIDHITKSALRTCGNERVTLANSVISTAQIAGDNAVRFFTDAAPAAGNGVADTWIAYRLRNNQIWFCPSCSNITCATCVPDNWGAAAAPQNIIATNITGFNIIKPNAANQLNEARIGIQLRACWNPAAGGCGVDPDNPEISMDADIKLPSVGVN